MFLSSLILFAARSTKGIKRLSLSERAAIIIPEDIKEILVGILLGDGHISRISSTANSRLHFGQTTKHKEYFKFVYNIFKSFCAVNYIPSFSTNIDKRNNEIYYSFHFVTMQLPCFNLFRELFYKFGKKVVPINIYDLLTARSLAFWIMDDGSRHGEGLHISAYGFSEEDIDRLLFVLQDKFKLKCSIHFNRDKKPRIYIKNRWIL